MGITLVMNNKIMNDPDVIENNESYICMLVSHSQTTIFSEKWQSGYTDKIQTP